MSLTKLALGWNTNKHAAAKHVHLPVVLNAALLLVVGAALIPLAYKCTAYLSIFQYHWVLI